MEALLEFGRSEEIARLAARYLEHPFVHGIHIDFDDLWLRACQQREQWPGERTPLPHWPSGRLRWPHLCETHFWDYSGDLDVRWRPPGWDDVMHERGLRPDPFVLVVIMEPDVDEHAYGLAEIPTDGIQVRFSVRPRARLYSDPRDAFRPIVGGVSVASPTGPSGTLGGVITAADGRRLAVTCGHVLDAGDEALQPAPADRAKQTARIGHCVHRAPLTPHQGSLDPYDPTLNAVDVALVELDDGITSNLELLGLGPLSGVATRSRVNPDAPVDVLGKVSGHRALRIGAVVLVQEFDFAGHRFGFRELFELRRSSRFHGITGTLSPPVRPGDSGGWVLRDGAHGHEWLGVVLAGSSPSGYAVPAQSITDWIDQSTPYGRVTVD